MRTKRNIHLSALAVSLFVLLGSFTNCSQMAALSDGSSSNSSLSVDCDEELLNSYKTNVYPFFRSTSTCIGCHIEGGAGLGVFASADVNSSFAAFEGSGFSTVEYMATNPQHKPPYTGVQNQPAMDKIAPIWNAAEAEHLSCVSKSQNGGVDDSLLTSAKAAPAIYASTNATQTLSWDLDLGSDLAPTSTRSIPARVTIDVKVLYQTNSSGVKIAEGYIFSNPTLALKTTGVQVVAEGLFFQINGQPISSQTTFTSLSKVVSGTQAIPLMVANANTLIQPVGSSDTFQLYFRRLVPTSGDGEASPPLTPILSLQDSSTGATDYAQSTTVNTFVLRDSGILRWCLSESATPPASTEAACNNPTPGTTNGWNLSRPTSFKLSSGDGPKTVYLWVANDSLLINTTPAQYSITLDSTPPAAPTITGITVGNTQVAAMTVTHPNESDVTGWCVYEQNAIAATGTPKLTDACWSWTDLGAKPTTVGFKNGGNRTVRVFVRDKAGNISAASNAMNVNNPYGAITYADLTASVSTPRSTFTNRCFTCHGSSSGPGYSKLQLFTYDGALSVVKSGQLLSRINNVLSPMPNVNGGLMPQEERDLIRLWTMPEEGGNPL